MEITISCFLNFKYLNLKQPGAVYNFILAIVFSLLVVVIFPIWTTYYLIKNKNILIENVFKQRFESLYLDVRPKIMEEAYLNDTVEKRKLKKQNLKVTSDYAYLFIPLFLLRRLLLAFTIVYIKSVVL